jgi:ATP/maltotriose-dependent transcriptional regulator MalT
VVAVDARRSWFRYHQLFADVLRLELRCAEPAELATLHGTAAGWFAAHGYPVEAVKHAQAAQDWTLAARMLSEHFLGLVRDGHGAAAHELLAGFPAAMLAADPALARLTAVRNPPAPPRGEPDRLREPLSGSEARVLRFLPTNLSGPEIADQLSVSVTTVRTHIRRLYEKLGVHSRTEAVEQARTLGLFAAS